MAAPRGPASVHGDRKATSIADLRMDFGIMAAFASTDATAEGVLVLAAAALVASTLASTPGWACEACALLVIAAGTVAVATACIRGSPSSSTVRQCHCRQGASDGHALGCCSPVLLLGALIAVRSRDSLPCGPLRAYIWAAIGCAVQPLLFQLLGRSAVSARVGVHMLGLTLGALPALALAGTTEAGLALAVLVLHAAAFDWAVARVRGSFTIGEAATLAQAVAILLVDALLMTACEQEARGTARSSLASLGDTVAGGPLCAINRPTDALASEALLVGGLALTAVLAGALQLMRRSGILTPTSPPYAGGAVLVALTALLLGGVLLPWLGSLVRQEAFAWLLDFLTAPGRPLLVAYWGGTIPLACLAAARIAPPRPEETPRALGGAVPAAPGPHRARLLLARKVYHLYAVALFAPGILLQPALLQVAFAGVLPIFALLELVRIEQLPPLARPLQAFLAPFLDARDAGPLILTHLYLLLGCAVPVWLGTVAPPPSLAPSVGGGMARAAVPYAGVLVLGVGDAFASAVGVHAGRTRWPGSRKTLEGSAAGAASTLAVLAMLLRLDGAAERSVSSTHAAWDQQPGVLAWAGISACTALAFVLEAFTLQIDNLFLPLFYQTLLLTVAARLS